MKKGMHGMDYDADDRGYRGKMGKRMGDRPNSYGSKGGAVGTARHPSSRGGYKRSGMGRRGYGR